MNEGETDLFSSIEVAIWLFKFIDLILRLCMIYFCPRSSPIRNPIIRKQCAVGPPSGQRRPDWQWLWDYKLALHSRDDEIGLLFALSTDTTLACKKKIR